MENISYREHRIDFWGSPRILFHPITAYLIGFLAYHLIPPFFSEDGHNWFIILLDLFAIVFFAIGVADGRIFKKICSGSSFKIRAGPEDFKLMLFVWFCLLWSFRAFHWYEAGIYSVLHPYSTQCHIYTTMKGELAAPFAMLLWYGAISLKKRYCYLLLFLEFLIRLPMMSRSFIFFFFLYGMIVYIFNSGLSRRNVIRFGVALLLLFACVGILSGYISAIRGPVLVEKRYDKIANVKFSDNISITKAARFIARRMNTHGGYKLIEGHERYVANQDLESLKSILPKLLGFEKEYRVSPTGVSNDVGRQIGFSNTHSAFVFPRTIILFHMGGFFAIAVFYLLFGALFGVLFNLFYSPKNMLFPMVYLILMLAYLAGGTGSLVGATAFQLLFKFATLFIPLSIFFTLKILKILVRPSPVNARQTH